MNNKKLATIFSFLLILGMVSAAIPDMNITAPSGETLFSHRNITIDFNVSDLDTNANGLSIDLNFSTSASQGTGTILIDNADLNSTTSITCNDLNLATSRCSFTFAGRLIPSSGSYFIIGSATDGETTTFDANGNFTFIRLPKEDALCATISSDLFAAGGCVDEDGFEDATTSSLAIGTLEFGDSFGLLVFLFIIAILAVVLTAVVLKFTVLGEMIFGRKQQN